MKRKVDFKTVSVEGLETSLIAEKLAGLRANEARYFMNKYKLDFFVEPAINVLYTIDDKKKRAVGFKLTEGMEIPKELESRFKFARQKSKLAGIIRGSFFVIKGEYW